MEDVLQRSLPTPAPIKQHEKLEVSERVSLDIRDTAVSIKEDLRASIAKSADFCTWEADSKNKVHPNLQERAALLDLIQDCAKKKDLHKGSCTHAHILGRGLLGKDVALGNALLSMYAKCGALTKAQELFNQFPARNVITWNALIAAYVQHGLNAEALHVLEQMQDEGLSPNAITFICSLKACGNLGAVKKGEDLHSEVCRQGFLEKDVALGTALVDMYAKCGVISKAQAVFDDLPMRNVATWTSLIDGYAQHGLGHEALICYSQMEGEGLSPNAVTFVCILKACSTGGDAAKGEKIHREVCKRGLIEKEILVGNALVDMYAKCGNFPKAQEVFKELPSRNTETWTVLLSGYVQHGLDDEALKCFDDMQDQGLCPDAVTYVCVLQACGNVGAVEKGEELNAKICKHGLSFKDTVLGTALVDMYAKCGWVRRAQQAFEELPVRNVATWTALISGNAHVGKMSTSSYLFYEMISEGVKPNLVTFLVLLNAFGHAGLVKEGQMYFEMMTKSWCIMPTSELYISIIDILSRAGCFDEAMSMIEYVQPFDHLRMWSSLMGASWKWENMELGRWAFEQILALDENFATAYICMRNIYVAAGMQGEAAY